MVATLLVTMSMKYVDNDDEDDDDDDDDDDEG